jgi:hypothetical protein
MTPIEQGILDIVELIQMRLKHSIGISPFEMELGRVRGGDSDYRAIRNQDLKAIDIFRADERIIGIIDELHPSRGHFIESNEDLLGVYMRMQSPGKIILYLEKLTIFLLQNMLYLSRQGHSVRVGHVKQMANIVVNKTYFHEQFHHLSDVSGYMFNSVYDKDTEEALACAFSYHKMLGHIKKSKEIDSDEPIIKNLIDAIYVYYGKGYRDWVNYSNESKLRGGLDAYLGNSKTLQLGKNRIDFPGILFGVHEKISTSVDLVMDYQDMDHMRHMLWR